MVIEVQLTQFDSQTKRYTAQLVVIEGERVLSYTCEGIWSGEKEAETVAEALYDQHRLAMIHEKNIAAEKAAIIAAVKDEVARKLAVEMR